MKRLVLLTALSLCACKEPIHSVGDIATPSTCAHALNGLNTVGEIAQVLVAHNIEAGVAQKIANAVILLHLPVDLACAQASP